MSKETVKSFEVHRAKETVKSFEVHRAEDGGYVVREPWTDGRIWVIATIEDFHKWIDVNVIK